MLVNQAYGQEFLKNPFLYHATDDNTSSFPTEILWTYG